MSNLHVTLALLASAALIGAGLYIAFCAEERRVERKQP